MAKTDKPPSSSILKGHSLSENQDANLKGQEIIKFIAKTLPHKPGVYQMENEKGNILYIGKAKNLSKRVINYTSLNNLTRRLQRMVSMTKKWIFLLPIPRLKHCCWNAR